MRNVKFKTKETKWLIGCPDGDKDIPGQNSYFPFHLLLLLDYLRKSGVKTNITSLTFRVKAKASTPFS